MWILSGRGWGRGHALALDHGKSTLADRLLELTGTIDKTKNNKQVLDKLQVERERGITVKAQTASLFYNCEGKQYLLNLIDTPGHVDFSYEVSRSLSACQGVLLVVDANEGIQAQTVANFFLAFEAQLSVIPVINKVFIWYWPARGIAVNRLEAKPMVFAGMYPVDQSEYNNLKSAIEKLTLNDSSVTVHRDSSLALGAGWRLGFLGLLHMEVFNQRLEQEYNASVILTTPTVPYKAVLSSAKLIKMAYIKGRSCVISDIQNAFVDKAHLVGKTICERLKDSLPRQLFEIAIQAAVGSKIIARETVKAYRKNVLIMRILFKESTLA
ncbi:PREDICTED: translation factor GUF1, mitochondrial [Propithecus coquereli]|uniref:translation factor GUF1, mitochondrial n=1 Tax=Propithecus coquereli TaxID=379532 RepID=UPI00063F8FA1|nr:PREDICTED: translation factor GUF1, mitochondrial [Propithecus coquereli]